MSEMDQSVPTSPRLQADDGGTKAPTSGKKLTGIKDWIYKNPAPSLTIAGVIVYTLLRVNYALFYGRLGVTPEDVGLTYVNILIQTIGVVAVTVYMLVYVVLIFLPLLLSLPFVPIGGALGLLLKRRLRQWALRICLLAALSIYLYLGLGRLYEVWKLFAIVAPLVGLFLGILTSRRLQGLASRDLDRIANYYWMKFILPLMKKRNLAIGSVYFIIAITFVILELTPLITMEMADDVKKGWSTQGGPQLITGIPWISLRGERAHISPKTVAQGSNPAQRSILTDQSCLMYLGESGGVAVFYDAQHKEVIRAPSTDLLITLGVEKEEECKPSSTSTTSTSTTSTNTIRGAGSQP